MSANSSTDIWLAGAFAAFTVDLLIYPLDTLKTRLQSPDYNTLYGSASSRALYRGLYQGLGSVILATIPSCMVQQTFWLIIAGAFFTTYEGVKSIGQKSPLGNVLPAPVIHSLASGIAELVSCAIITPAEVIKQNAQMVQQDAAASTSAMKQTMKRFRDNPKALWKGYGALAGRNLPFTALQFPIFEQFKTLLVQTSWFGNNTPEKQRTLIERGTITGIAAGAAGGIAAVVTNPIDMIKTRIMLAASSSSGSPLDQLKTTAKEAVNAVKEADSSSPKDVAKRLSEKSQIWTTGRDIFQKDGVRGLMRGGLLRTVWTMLGSGLYLGVYETARLYLAQKPGNTDDFE